MKVQDFLRGRNVRFDVLPHTKTFDSQHLAEALHVPGKQVAKTVLLRLNGGYKYLVAVVPATHVVDMEALKKVFGGVHAELACQDEITARCPDCEAGVLPPFGSKYGLQTVVDKSLTEDEQIVFEGNTHEEAIRMRYSDYYNLEHPLVVSIASRGVPAGARTG